MESLPLPFHAVAIFLLFWFLDTKRPQRESLRGRFLLLWCTDAVTKQPVRHLQLVVFQVEIDNGFDRFPVHVELDILVRRVYKVRFQAETHKHCLHAKYLFEGSNDRYAAATTCRNGTLTECFFEPALGCFVGREVDWAHNDSTFTFTVLGASRWK